MDKIWCITGKELRDLLLDVEDANVDDVPLWVAVDDGYLKFKCGEGPWSVGIDNTWDHAEVRT